MSVWSLEMLCFQSVAPAAVATPVAEVGLIAVAAAKAAIWLIGEGDLDLDLLVLVISDDGAAVAAADLDRDLRSGGEKVTFLQEHTRN